MYKTYIETTHESRDRLGPLKMGQAGYLLTGPRTNDGCMYMVDQPFRRIVKEQYLMIIL